MQDMQKYLELETLVKEKNDVLQRLSHLPINVRDSISESILLSEQQFNMLTNFQVTKKVIVANGMVTKLEVGTEENCLYVGGAGTFISKYSLETKQLLLASEKIYFCNGLLVDKHNQVWVLDGKKYSLVVLNNNLQERRTFQGLSFDRRFFIKAEGGFFTTEVICLDSRKVNMYWFRGKGMITRISCESLEREDYEISITSKLDIMLGSDFIRNLDVNESETLLVSLDIDFKKLNIFDLVQKKRLANWEYKIKGIEDAKSYTLCCSFDKKLILLGGEAGDLMKKTPIVTLHHFTNKLELIDMLVIKTSRDPIISLHADVNSGIIFGTDMSENIFLMRIGDSFNLQLLRILSKIQEGSKL